MYELLANLGLSKTLFSKGALIFEEGSPVEGMFYVCRGKIKLSKNEADGKEIIVKISTADHLLGHRCFFTRKTYGMSAITLEDSEIITIDQETLTRLLFDREILTYFVKTLGLELEEDLSRISSLLRKNVRSRLAEFLLLHLENVGNTDERKINLHLSREEMAAAVGTSSETVSRYLSAFKANGFIKEENQNIYVLSPQELERYSNQAHPSKPD